MPYRCVRELIERDVLVSAASSTTVRAAAQAMAEHACGSILVTEEEYLVGIFTRHDLLTRVAAAGCDPDATLLGAVMTRAPETIPADAPVEAVTARLGELGHRYLPVVEDGRVIGVLSAQHLLLREPAPVRQHG
jgi:CBS domain-containing protein